MKKLLALTLAVMMVLSLAACGGSDTPAAPSAPTDGSAEAPAADGAPSASGDTIKVGLLANTTGDNAMYGNAVKNGAMLYFDEVNAAGGVLGKVISVSGMVQYITENSCVLSTIGIFFPFVLAAILKTAQGSSTVAITTTAGMLAPVLPALGLNTPSLSALCVIAIGAGAMTVSHANDSYFWVVTNFGEMETEQGYKTQTMGTLIIGLASMVGVFIAYLVLK